MIITNLAADPKALKTYGALNATASADGDHTKYTVVNAGSIFNSAIANVFPPSMGIPVYLVVILDGNADKIIIEQSQKITTSTTHAVWKHPGTGNSAIFLHNISGSATIKPGDSVTLRGIAAYTESDWQALQSLGLDYFDGGTMPLAS